MTFLLGKDIIPSPSWKRTLDLMFAQQETLLFYEVPPGSSNLGVLDSVYEGTFRGVTVPLKKEDI